MYTYGLRALIAARLDASQTTRRGVQLNSSAGALAPLRTYRAAAAQIWLLVLSQSLVSLRIDTRRRGVFWGNVVAKITLRLLFYWGPQQNCYDHLAPFPFSYFFVQNHVSLPSKFQEGSSPPSPTSPLQRICPSSPKKNVKLHHLVKYRKFKPSPRSEIL